MERHIELFGSIKIPIYVIACGVQARSYDELPYLIEEIGYISKKFIRSVYQTGGEFCLRGYFTKEFFDIPIVSKQDIKRKDLYEIYSNISYKQFNDSFPEKYKNYENFLIDRGIAKKANTVPLLSNNKNNCNKERLDYLKNIKADNSALLEEIIKNKSTYKMLDFAKEMHNRLKRL